VAGAFLLLEITVDDARQDVNHSFCPTTSMKPHFSLSSLLIIGLIAFPTLLHAQAVTWGATGLPPGMSVSSLNGTTARISGTPTTPGNYKAIIFPRIGNVIGDMASVPITVLPSGVSLPLFYGYNRLTANGSLFALLAGGSGYLFGYYWSGSSSFPLFTTNGTTFTQPSLPNGDNPFANGTAQAAIAGSRCLVCGNGTLAYSDNRGAFKSLALPSGITDQGGGDSAIGGNGINRFFYAYINWNDNNTYSIRLFSMQNNQTTWVSRGTFNLPASVNELWSPSITVAVNGSLLVMAIQANNSPGLLLTSINGGDTWTVNSSNPGIMSVAYGNGFFLGTGNGGVWKSTNGINWTRISTNFVGNISYSSPEGCFFSIDNGVSKDGVYWMQYGEGTRAYGGIGGGGPPVSSGTGMLFFPGSGQQLSTTYIPSFYARNPRLLNVGKATSFNLVLDAASSGSISQ
jgi:hypothetical protein